MNVQTIVRSVEFTGTQPKAGDSPGTHGYAVTIEVRSDFGDSKLTINVTTPEGFTAAAAMACDQLFEYGKALAVAAEEAKKGPHPIILF